MTDKAWFRKAPWRLGALPIALALVPAWSALARETGHVRTVDGVSFYEGDPGEVTDSFWTSGQYKYDPHGYMDINRWDAGVHVNTVYADHVGRDNCVFRRRVQVDNWDSRHPWVRVCRREE